jgi:hypothetical protein
VTNPAGAKLHVGPGDDTPLVFDEHGRSVVARPYVGWETGPGPSFVTRHAVNHYRWVTQKYRPSRNPTRRGWVSVGDIDCSPSAQMRTADFLHIALYDLPTGTDTAVLDHLITAHGLNANYEVFTPAQFAALTEDELNDFDVWMIGSSEPSEPSDVPCTTGATPCVTPADYDGLRNNSVFQQGALRGRRVLTGQDPDDHALRHDTDGHGASARLLLNAIRWAGAGSGTGTGIVVLADPASHLDWTPEAWGVRGLVRARNGAALELDEVFASHPVNGQLSAARLSFGGVRHTEFLHDVDGYETLSRGVDDSLPVTIVAELSRCGDGLITPPETCEPGGAPCAGGGSCDPVSCTCPSVSTTSTSTSSTTSTTLPPTCDGAAVVGCCVAPQAGPPFTTPDTCAIEFATVGNPFPIDLATICEGLLQGTFQSGACSPCGSMAACCDGILGPAGSCGRTTAFGDGYTAEAVADGCHFSGGQVSYLGLCQ